MVSITLEVLTAKLTSSFGERFGVGRYGKWVLSGVVKLPRRERLELGTGEKVSELQMVLAFLETDAERLEWVTNRTKDVESTFERDNKAVCGSVTYHKARGDPDGFDGQPASLLFNVFAPPDVMASLIRFAEGGRFPKIVTLEVHGMEYGYAPDGSMKRWLNNSEVKMLPVLAVNYELPLNGEADGERSPDEPSTRLGPIPNETLRWVKGAVWILVAISCVIVFKNWR